MSEKAKKIVDKGLRIMKGPPREHPYFLSKSQSKQIQNATQLSISKIYSKPSAPRRGRLKDKQLFKYT